MTNYTIINMMWDLVRGKLKLASSSVAKERYSICKQCPIRNPKLNTCTICGCYMPIKTKLKDASCPAGEW